MSALTLYSLNSFFVVLRDIGSFRPPTHSRDAHNEMFLVIPSKINIKILAKRAIYGTLVSKELRGAVLYVFLGRSFDLFS